MFTIKLYADGHTFIRSATSIEIINQGSENYHELCATLKEDYLASGVVDDQGFEANENSLSVDDQKEHWLESNMPHTFMFYESDGEPCKWYFHGDDTAYIVNEQGKTIERVKGVSVMSSLVESEQGEEE